MRRLFAWLSTVDACFDYRIRLPLLELNRSGAWEIAWGAPGPDIAEYDVVVGQRLAGPQPLWLKLCADPNVFTVYDADDDLTALDPANTVPYSIYAPLADDTRANMAAADLVTCCVPAAAERIAATINPNVAVLPICIDPAWIDLPLRTRAGTITVGWGGSPFHHQDWQALAPRLVEYAARVPHAAFHAMGADYTAGAFGSRLRVTGLQPLPDYIALIDFDIGLAPLDCTLRGSRTRSWTKPLEYAARGVPVVAQACGQYLDFVEPGRTGFLVRDDADWVDYLVALTNDDLRAAMSTVARAKAREWTIDRHIDLWDKAYRGEPA